MPRKLSVSKPTGRIFLQAWREHRGLTQEKLADRMDMSPSNLSRLENGRIAYTQQRLEAAAAALLIEPGDLFRDPEAPEAEVVDLLRLLSPDDQRRAAEFTRALAQTRKAG